MYKLRQSLRAKSIYLTLAFGLLSLVVLGGCGGAREESITLSDDEIMATAEVLASTSIAKTVQAMLPTTTLRPTAATSSTPLPSPTATATEVLTSLTANQAINCRNGPGTQYMILIQLEEARSIVIGGRNDVNSWWYVEPQELDEGCWLFGGLVTVEGLTAHLPLVESSALPLIGIDPRFILYFLIAEDTGGTVACGDSLVAFNTGILRTEDAAEDTKIAIRALLSIGSPYVSGYRHSGYQSNLQVLSADYSSGTQVVNIYLSGTVIKPEDNCDKERFRVQIFATAQQFDTVRKAFVWVGTVPIGDYLVQN